VHLTDRESEILELIQTGSSYKQVADRLHISVNTVSNHLANVRQKLGAHSVIEALFLARGQTSRP
jgi:DNA-binding CsgD family transcriptional regulator